MAILKRPHISAQQRIDLEDWRNITDFVQMDSYLWHKFFLSDENVVINGFEVDAGGTFIKPGAAVLTTRGTDDASIKTAKEDEKDFSFIVEKNNIDIKESTVTRLGDQLVLTVSLKEGDKKTKGFWNISTSSESAQDAVVEKIVNIASEVIVSGGSIGENQILIATRGVDDSGAWVWVRASKPLSSDGSVGLNEEDFGTLGKVLTDLKKQIKAIKGTPLWSTEQNKNIGGLLKQVNSVLVGANANVKWKVSKDTPGVLSVTGQVDIKLFGSPDIHSFNTADPSNGSFNTVGQVLYYDLKSTGLNKPKVTNFENDILNDTDIYWLAYRDTYSRIFIRGYGELEKGESTPVSDPSKEELIVEIDKVKSASEDKDQAIIDDNMRQRSFKITAGTYSYANRYMSFSNAKGCYNTGGEFNISGSSINIPDGKTIYIDTTNNVFTSDPNATEKEKLIPFVKNIDNKVYIGYPNVIDVIPSPTRTSAATSHGALSKDHKNSNDIIKLFRTGTNWFSNKILVVPIKKYNQKSIKIPFRQSFISLKADTEKELTRGWSALSLVPCDKVNGEYEGKVYVENPVSTSWNERPEFHKNGIPLGMVYVSSSDDITKIEEAAQVVEQSGGGNTSSFTEGAKQFMNLSPYKFMTVIDPNDPDVEELIEPGSTAFQCIEDGTIKFDHSDSADLKNVLTIKNILDEELRNHLSTYINKLYIYIEFDDRIPISDHFEKDNLEILNGTDATLANVGLTKINPNTDDATLSNYQTIEVGLNKDDDTVNGIKKQVPVLDSFMKDGGSKKLPILGLKITSANTKKIKGIAILYGESTTGYPLGSKRNSMRIDLSTIRDIVGGFRKVQTDWVINEELLRVLDEVGGKIYTVNHGDIELDSADSSVLRIKSTLITGFVTIEQKDEGLYDNSDNNRKLINKNKAEANAAIEKNSQYVGAVLERGSVPNVKSTDTIDTIYHIIALANPECFVYPLVPQLKSQLRNIVITPVIDSAKIHAVAAIRNPNLYASRDITAATAAVAVDAVVNATYNIKRAVFANQLSLSLSLGSRIFNIGETCRDKFIETYNIPVYGNVVAFASRVVALEAYYAGGIAAYQRNSSKTAVNKRLIAYNAIVATVPNSDAAAAAAVIASAIYGADSAEVLYDRGFNDFKKPEPEDATAYVIAAAAAAEDTGATTKGYSNTIAAWRLKNDYLNVRGLARTDVDSTISAYKISERLNC